MSRSALLAVFTLVSLTLVGIVLWAPDLGEADGALESSVTVFDDRTPAVANLDPELIEALRRAARDAATERIEIVLKSAWRSAKYQAQLFQAAVSKYGSKRTAARWVARPDRSLHVSGDAVDIGPSSAIAWLSKQGSEYGLCRVYRNEPWHFELRSRAVKSACPPAYADPSHDPRMIAYAINRPIDVKGSGNQRRRRRQVLPRVRPARRSTEAGRGASARTTGGTNTASVRPALLGSS